MLTVDHTTNSIRSVLVLSDHELDPRLRRRVRWIEEICPEVIICRHGRAEWVGDEEFLCKRRSLDYSDDKSINGFTGGLCYVSGAKILWDKRFVLSKLRRANRIIFEVPDLPLRSRSMVKNFAIAKFFSFMFGRLAHAGVVTAPEFLRHLPKELPYLLLENFPELEIAEALAKLEPPRRFKGSGEPIHIGFVGAIRYGEQIRLLLRYGCRRKGVVIHFFGGPLKALNKIIEEEREMSSGWETENIKVHGPYVFEEEICDIYESLDILYAVYDAGQPNVCMALPNKLYEAALANRSILAAEGTSFAQVVLNAGIGESLPSALEDYPRFEEKLDAFIDKKWSVAYRPCFSQHELARCREQKPIFQLFINNICKNM